MIIEPPPIPAEEAFRALLRASSLARGKMDAHFSSFGLSGSQWGVLRVISRAEAKGEPSVRLVDLVKRLLVTPPSITGVVGRLERMGYVKRVATDDDLRAKHVQLTAEGRKLMKRVLVNHRERVKETMAGLPESDLRELARLLKCVSDKLIQSEGGAK